MNKEILNPESLSAERKLIRELCELSQIKNGSDMAESLLAEVNDPFEIFRDSNVEASNIEYTDVRRRALMLLISSIAGVNIRERLNFVPAVYWNDKTASQLISLVREPLKASYGEKLIVIFYTESKKVKDLYESESWEMFGCDTKIDRLKRFIRKNAPCYFVMIHSHPGRSVKASVDDIRFTQAIRFYAERIGAILTEHFVTSCSDTPDDFVGILGQMSE